MRNFIIETSREINLLYIKVTRSLPYLGTWNGWLISVKSDQLMLEKKKRLFDSVSEKFAAFDRLIEFTHSYLKILFVSENTNFKWLCQVEGIFSSFLKTLQFFDRIRFFLLKEVVRFAFETLPWWRWKKFSVLSALRQIQPTGRTALTCPKACTPGTPSASSNPTHSTQQITLQRARRICSISY